MASAFSIHRGDLPEDVKISGHLAVDTETMGLDLRRDRLCLVQLQGEEPHCHVVQIERGQKSAPVLQTFLEDPRREKIFHFARFDLARLQYWLGILSNPVFCTKMAARLVLTNWSGHGYGLLCQELLGISLDKSSQCSDWAAETLTEAQIQYAVQDVRHLHALREVLWTLLKREERTHIAQACFRFLPWRSGLDVAGWAEEDIFSYALGK